LHAAAVVHDGQGAPDRIRGEGDGRRLGVERVGDDFGEDGFLGRAGVGIAEVFQQVEEIDSGLTHEP
jgi:hypothetical protein